MGRRALAAGVPIRQLGASGGGVIAVVDERPLRIEYLARRFESWLPDYRYCVTNYAVIPGPRA